MANNVIFEPFAIKGVEFRNRVLRSSMGGRHSFYDGTPSPTFTAFEKRFAAGGVAGVISATITIDDDGPGIPPAMREEVFKPFLRLDDARNQDEGGTGLGLAIARDIARSHGGDIMLGDSPLGGLRASVRVPV